MLALAPQEDLEMRLHVKCSGPTKKFGKGVFVVTNQRMLYDSYDDGLCFSHPINRIDGIKRIGNHEFCLRWYEDKHPYFFQAKIEKHYDWKPTAQDLFDRWLETLASYDPRGYDGWRCDSYGVIHNIYMPEYNENIRTGEFTPEMEDNICADKEWGDTHDVHIGKGKIKLNMYVAITDLWHDKKQHAIVNGLEGDTYEDQRLYRRYKKFLAIALDNNYHTSMGMLVQSTIKEYFKSFMTYVKRDEEGYRRVVVGANKFMKDLKNDKEINATRVYVDNMKLVDGMYGYRHDSWAWSDNVNPDNHSNYVRDPFRFVGTQERFIARMAEEHSVRKRIREIMDTEHQQFVWVKNFWFRVYELHGSLLKRLQAGSDISSYVPPTEYKPRMPEAEMKIREFEKRLREPF